MKENFIICVEAVIPMFLMIVIGFIVKRTGLVDDKLTTKMNSLAFRVLFPFLMFQNVYSAEISEVINLKLIVFTVTAVGVIYGLGTAVTLAIEKENTSRGAMIQAIYRSNFVIMGMPVASNIYGHGNVGVTAVMVAIIVPLFNVLAVVTLETYRNSKVQVSVILKNIAKNPLIIGAMFGIIASLLEIHLPDFLETTVSDIAGCATPIALMILGASFNFTAIKTKMRNLIIICVARLGVAPALVLTAAALMGFRDISFVTLLGIFAAPCAISSYTMAQQMGSDGPLAGASVIFTSALSSFTMFLWLFLFKSIGIF